MAKEYSRTARVADHLQRELAGLIQREVRDPRVGMVNITGVDVSRDMGHAKVYYTVFLRSQLSRDSSMRSVPQLRFYFDNSVGRGRYLEDLISKAADADRELGLRADEPGNEE
jgi:ribosome-binding factor A